MAYRLLGLLVLSSSDKYLNLKALGPNFVLKALKNKFSLECGATEPQERIQVALEEYFVADLKEPRQSQDALTGQHTKHFFPRVFSIFSPRTTKRLIIWKFPLLRRPL